MDSRPRRMRVRASWSLILTTCLLVGAGCSTPHDPSPSAGPASGGPSVSGLPSGHPLSVEVATTQPPQETFIQQLSQTWDLGPSGALPNAVQVTIPLTTPLPTGESVVVATREGDAAPWEYLAGRVEGQAVSFSTDHFSKFVILGISAQGVLDWFKSNWRSGVSQGLLQGPTQPTCTGADQLLKDGYNITASGPSVLLACWGQQTEGIVLKAVNPHLYPVQIAYGTSTSVLSQRDAGFRFTDLARLGSGRTVLLGPGDSVTFIPAPSPGSTTQEVASLDGASLGLYQLQVGFEVAAAFLSKFGIDQTAAVRTGVFAAITADDLLSSSDCSSAIRESGAADVWTKCVLKIAIPKLFRTLNNPVASAGLTILMAYLLVGDLVTWIVTEGQALAHVADRQTIVISSPKPTASVKPVTGSWWVHGGGLTITSTMASAVAEMGQCDTGANALRCEQYMDLKPQTLSPSQVKLTVLRITVKDTSGAVRSVASWSGGLISDWWPIG